MGTESSTKDRQSQSISDFIHESSGLMHWSGNYDSQILIMDRINSILKQEDLAKDQRNPLAMQSRWVNTRNAETLDAFNIGPWIDALTAFEADNHQCDAIIVTQNIWKEMRKWGSAVVKESTTEELQLYKLLGRYSGRGTRIFVNPNLRENRVILVEYFNNPQVVVYDFAKTIGSFTLLETGTNLDVYRNDERVGRIQVTESGIHPYDLGDVRLVS